MFYELTLFTTYFSQRCVNVFNFILTGTPAAVTGSFGLAYAFGAIPTAGIVLSGSIFEQLQAMVSQYVIFNQVRVKNPYDVTDFYSVPFPNGTIGLQTGEALSPTAALSIFSNQTRLDIQAGQKRYVGVPESYSAAGGTLTSSAMTALQELADRHSEPLTYDDEGNTLTYNLVVAKKYNDLEADPPVVNAYWPTLTQQVANSAVGLLWTPRPYTSTQTTRQYGHGR